MHARRRPLDYAEMVVGRARHRRPARGEARRLRRAGVARGPRHAEGDGRRRARRRARPRDGGGRPLPHARARRTRTAPTCCTCPPGDALLTPTLKGWAIPAATPAAGGAATVDLSLPKRATLEVDVKDATHERAAARARAGDPVGCDRARARGVRRPDAGRRRPALARLRDHRHVASSRCRPGQHRVVVTRGYEYELFDATVDARPRARPRRVQRVAPRTRSIRPA